MDKELARHIVVTAFRGSSYLDSLMPTLKQHLSNEEYAPYRKAITSLIGGIHDQLVRRVFTAYPELEEEIGNHIQKFGHLT